MWFSLGLDLLNRSCWKVDVSKPYFSCFKMEIYWAMGVFFVAIQSGKALFSMNRRGKIEVDECQKKKKNHKRIDSIQRQEVESLFLTIHLLK